MDGGSIPPSSTNYSHAQIQQCVARYVSYKRERRKFVPHSNNKTAAVRIIQVCELDPVSGKTVFGTGTRTGVAVKAVWLPPAVPLADTPKPYFIPGLRPVIVHDVAGAVEIQNSAVGLTDDACADCVLIPAGMATAVYDVGASPVVGALHETSARVPEIFTLMLET